jgi:hypothetical protein
MPKSVFLILWLMSGSLLPIRSLAQPLPNGTITTGFRSVNLGTIVSNEIIHKVTPGDSAAQLNGLLSGNGIKRIENNIISGTQRILIPASNVTEIDAHLVNI